MSSWGWWLGWSRMADLLKHSLQTPNEKRHAEMDDNRNWKRHRQKQTDVYFFSFIGIDISDWFFLIMFYSNIFRWHLPSLAFQIRITGSDCPALPCPTLSCPAPPSTHLPPLTVLWSRGVLLEQISRMLWQVSASAWARTHARTLHSNVKQAPTAADRTWRIEVKRSLTPEMEGWATGLSQPNHRAMRGQD